MPDYLEKFEKMRVAGKLAARTLDMLTDNIKPDVTTEFIDKLGYEFIRDNDGYSAPLFYRGFKKSLCTSLNHVVCHGTYEMDSLCVRMRSAKEPLCLSTCLCRLRQYFCWTAVQSASPCAMAVARK